LKRGEGIKALAGVDPGYLNAGLMKPRRGFTLVAGESLKERVLHRSRHSGAGWRSFRAATSEAISRRSFSPLPSFVLEPGEVFRTLHS
jgi:hypothetical protein